jgi:cystathionine gamma-synthase
LGADIILHSATKYLSGHHDVLAGVLVLNDEGLNERLRIISKTIGSVLSPFDSYLVIRGIKTLPVRMERSQETTKVVADWLITRSEIKNVHYIGFESHLGYEITRRQASGFGAILSFTMHDEETTKRLLTGVKVLKFAPSLGGVESLITYPMLQTHGDIPEEERRARGVDSCLVRLSIGLETAKDLIDDLTQALER